MSNKYEGMDRGVIVTFLKKERDRLDSAIAVLGGEADPHKRGRRPKVQSIDAGRQTGSNTGSNTGTGNTGSNTGTGRKRVLSPEARKRMSEAAKKRWAEAKTNTGTNRKKAA